MNKLSIVMIGASLQQNGGIATVENLILKYASPDVEIDHITSHDEGSIIHRIKVFGLALLALVWRLLRKKTDLVHIHISDGGSLLRKAIFTLIAFLFGKPVLIHAHGAEFHVTYSKLPSRMQKVLNEIFCRCDGFIVLSKTWQEYYRLNLGLDEKQVFILPNPTELPSQIPHRKNIEKTKFGFFGRVGERKGTFDLIKAFANLSNELKNRSELIIAGDGDIEQGRHLVESLNLTKYVTFLGWINAAQRDVLLEKIDAFVLPSYNEGLPMALLEAMGWGLPAIVTPVGGIPELVTSGKNGLLVTTGDIQQLSTAMQSLIENEALRLSLGSGARQSVTAFDVKTYSSLLTNIYGSFVKSKPNSTLSTRTAA